MGHCLFIRVEDEMSKHTWEYIHTSMYICITKPNIRVEHTRLFVRLRVVLLLPLPLPLPLLAC